MKRSKFIASLIALGAAPLIGNTKNKKQFPVTARSFKANAGEGRLHGHITLKGVNSNVLDVKVSGSDTDGGMAIFEQTSLSPGRGTPLHIHHNQDEVFYVVDGSYYFQVGEDKYHLSTGDTIFMPKKVPHAWTQVSQTGKMVVTFQPAGKMESFFVTMAAIDHTPTREEIAKVFADNEMEVVGPPLKTE